MPKSRQRKAHKQKVRSRGIQKQCRAKQVDKIKEEIRRLGEEQWKKQMEESKANENAENAEQVEGIDDLELEDIEDDILEEIDIDVVDENNKTSE